MPTYVYKFLDTGETLEIQQSFTDDTLTEAVHPRTGATMPVKKVFQPVGVTFKGDGFYKTDSRASSKSGTASKTESSSSDSGSVGTSTSTDTGPGSDAKKTAAPASTHSTSSSSGSSAAKSTSGSSTSSGTPPSSD